MPPKSLSPLRYPGGKSCLFHDVRRIVTDNYANPPVYAEPYAGGCGLALRLLFDKIVSHIYINDLDYSIWCFWDCILNDTENFIRKIYDTEITIDEWYKQKYIQSNRKDYTKLEIGFSTFFLNRTNRSGIIKAGVIGGKEQKGNYKLDCRFNKKNLISRIEDIYNDRHRIRLFNQDAVEFLKHIDIQQEDIFICIDPPYYKKGASLYTNFYKPEDHKVIADCIHGLQKDWIVTYDNADEIKALYPHYRQYEFNLNYSVQSKRIATEIMISSQNISVNNPLNDAPFFRLVS